MSAYPKSGVCGALAVVDGLTDLLVDSRVLLVIGGEDILLGSTLMVCPLQFSRHGEDGPLLFE